MENPDEKYYRAYLEHNTITRRGLFRGLFAGANKAARSHSQPFIVRDAPRPPGAIEEGVFQALCQKCTDKKCARACPEQVIEIINGFPQLNLDFSHCTHCNACAKACDFGAITPQDAEKTAPLLHADIGVRPVFSNNCNYRISGSCDACAKICPTQAIAFISDQLPTVNNAHCIGCGQCRSACFLGAIQLIFKGAS